ncbi:MAG: winged helix-turn-helix domain-containing protein [Bdellovibrionales bacterium]
MPDIYIHIPDISLREAVVEQIKAAQLGDPRIIDSSLAALKQENEEKPNIVIVDSFETDEKTEALIRALNNNPGNPTIVLLGGTDDIEGVTETLSKPLRLGHLVARIKYFLETAPLLRVAAVMFGPYRLEPQNRRILRNGEPEPIRLTEKETALLIYLARNKTPVTRKDVLADVWGYDEQIDTHTLETHIYQLRRKLDKDGENWLVNEAGTYRLAGMQE